MCERRIVWAWGKVSGVGLYSLFRTCVRPSHLDTVLCASINEKGRDRILSVTPDTIFLALCFARIWYLTSQPIVLARAGYVHFGAKCLGGGLVTAALAATTGLLATKDTGLPYITIISAGLSFASSVSPPHQLLPYFFYS